jgi:hypothetical protein
MIHSSTATISERSLPDALGLEVLEMVVKQADRPIKGFDDKSTLQPPEADWTPRREGYDFKEAKRLLTERGGLMSGGLLSGRKKIVLAFRRQCISSALTLFLRQNG